MSGAVDVNILIYDAEESSPFHAKAKKFLTHLFESDETIYFTWDTLHAYLR